MKQHLWKSLTVSALLITLGSGTSSHAEPTHPLSLGSAPNLPGSEPLNLPETAVSESVKPRAVDWETPGKLATQKPLGKHETNLLASQAVLPATATVTKIYPHMMDGQVAATLYVENIPVLTFLGETVTQPLPPDSVLSGKTPASVPVAQMSVVSLSETEPVRQAEAVAQKLSEWVRTPEDAKAIALKWDKDLETYIIAAHDQTLVVMGKEVILPDTTRNFTQDAVQATNRLRRLLGNAPPLTEIYGKPVSAPAQEPNNTNPFPGEWVVAKALSGWASWYGPGFHGNLTANGEVYNQYGLTAAHRSLPFGTMVRVTNMDNGRTIMVRINDRGPYTRNRIIDLSAGAAQELGLMQSGVAPVRVEVMTRSSPVASDTSRTLGNPE